MKQLELAKKTLEDQLQSALDCNREKAEAAENLEIVNQLKTSLTKAEQERVQQEISLANAAAELQAAQDEARDCIAEKSKALVAIEGKVLDLQTRLDQDARTHSGAYGRLVRSRPAKSRGGTCVPLPLTLWGCSIRISI